MLLLLAESVRDDTTWGGQRLVFVSHNSHSPHTFCSASTPQWSSLLLSSDKELRDIDGTGNGAEEELMATKKSLQHWQLHWGRSDSNGSKTQLTLASSNVDANATNFRRI